MQHDVRPFLLLAWLVLLALGPLACASSPTPGADVSADVLDVGDDGQGSAADLGPATDTTSKGEGEGADARPGDVAADPGAWADVADRASRDDALSTTEGVAEPGGLDTTSLNFPR